MHQFGLYLREIDDMKPYFGIAEEPYPEKTAAEQVIIAEIKNRRFTNLTLAKYSKTTIEKYLYRELAAARATSIVPTLHFYFVPGEDNLKTSCAKFFDKLERCLDNNKLIYEKHFETEVLKDGIRTTLKSFVSEKFTEKKNYLFTIQIDDKWLGEIPDIKAILESTSYDKYFRDSKGEFFLGKDKTCAVTYQQNTPEVWGRVDTLGFTVNDISFSRNGFKAKDSFKMFPVSPSAVKVLEGTMRALKNRLSLNFAGVKFFVLPHFVTLGRDILREKNIVRAFIRKITESTEPGFDPLLNSIFNSEVIFSKIIDDPELGKNSVYYDIFFYEEKQAQFAIKLHVSDVLPSRFRAIREAKRQVTALYAPITFKEFKNNNTFTFSPNFYNIKDYFAIKREKETIIEPYFYKIVEAIFYKNRLDEEQILRAYMQKIVPAFKNSASNSYAFPDHVKHSFCIHQFFIQLQLFGKMEPAISSNLILSAFEFVKEHDAFFKNRLQKAAFLLGCSVEVLLNSQRSNLNGNEPFSKRLNNLSVDYKELQRIKAELLSKSMQYADAKKLYSSDYIQQLLVEFDKLMMSGDDSILSKTQISYAFSVGLVMEKEFTKLRIADFKAQKEAKKKTQEPEILEV
jgi:CRISPR-associated Csh1 family protein